jgi:nicotinamidase-related amidase
VVTEYCVRCAALGLLRLGKPVEVVTDAIQTLKEEDGRRALEEIVAAGGRLTTTDDVVARKAA